MDVPEFSRKKLKKCPTQSAFFWVPHMFDPTGKVTGLSFMAKSHGEICTNDAQTNWFFSVGFPAKIHWSTYLTNDV